MKYRKYTEKSPEVSEIGFGAWQLGNTDDWGRMSEKEAIELVQRALFEGVNFFDTAPNYAGGNSERLLGKALSSTQRSSIVISTKFGHWPDGHTDFGAGSIRKSVEGSLLRLKTDYIDLVLLHNPGFEIVNGSSEEHYQELEKLKDEGKILAYGASLDTADEMTAFMENTGGEVIEAFFNIIHQDTRKAFDIAYKKGVAIIAKIPLDSGWLTGKYNKDSRFEGIRSRWTEDDIQNRAKIIDMLRNYPKEQTMAQFAIGFCLAYEAVSTVIPGNVNTSQLEMNIKSSEYSISDSVIKELEELYEKKIKGMNIPW
ncbi:MAG: aldo/keto reductase [Clostridia bacterium]|nr:aldo/keto reductase [Clostridia bacterium]